MTIESFINSKLPIQNELLLLFKKETELIIFDIGACEAEDSIRYSNLFPNSSIYSFEPLPENINQCLLNIKKYNKQDKILLFGFALSNQAGIRSFHVSSGSPFDTTNANESWNYGNKSSSLLLPNTENNPYNWLKFNKEIKVETETVYNICTYNKIKGIDFIHIDVQGAELEALEGAGSFLLQTKVVWMEVEKKELYSKQPLKNDVEYFMKKNNFIKLIDNVSEISGDQLWVNRTFFYPYSLKIISIKILIYVKKIYSVFNTYYKSLKRSK